MVNDGLVSLCAVIYSKFLIVQLVVQKNKSKISSTNCELIAISPNIISGKFEVDEEIADFLVILG